MQGGVPSQPVARKFYAISDINKQNALQLLFPSVQLEEQDGEMGFIATPSQATLMHNAIAAHLKTHLKTTEDLETKVKTPAVSASQDWLPKPVSGLLYGLGAATVALGLVGFPLIEALSRHTINSDADMERLKGIYVTTLVVGEFIGGMTGAMIGTYQWFKERLLIR